MLDPWLSCPQGGVSPGRRAEVTSRQRTRLTHQRAQDRGSTHGPQPPSGKLPGHSSCPHAAWPQAGAVQRVRVKLDRRASGLTALTLQTCDPAFSRSVSDKCPPKRAQTVRLPPCSAGSRARPLPPTPAPPARLPWACPPPRDQEPEQQDQATGEGPSDRAATPRTAGGSPGWTCLSGWGRSCVLR